MYNSTPSPASPSLALLPYNHDEIEISDDDDDTYDHDEENDDEDDDTYHNDEENDDDNEDMNDAEMNSLSLTRRQTSPRRLPQAPACLHAFYARECSFSHVSDCAAEGSKIIIEHGATSRWAA